MKNIENTTLAALTRLPAAMLRHLIARAAESDVHGRLAAAAAEILATRPAVEPAPLLV